MQTVAWHADAVSTGTNSCRKMISYAVAFKWENDWQPFSVLMILYAVSFWFLDIFVFSLPSSIFSF